MSEGNRHIALVRIMLIASLIFFRSHSTTESIEVCANQAEKGELFFVFRQLCPWSHYYFSVKQAHSLCLTNIQLHIYQTWEPSHFGFSNIHIVLKTLSIYHSITMHTKTRLSQWNFIQAPIRYDTNGIFFFFFRYQLTRKPHPNFVSKIRVTGNHVPSSESP